MPNCFLRRTASFWPALAGLVAVVLLGCDDTPTSIPSPAPRADTTKALSIGVDRMDTVEVDRDLRLVFQANSGVAYRLSIVGDATFRVRYLDSTTGEALTNWFESSTGSSFDWTAPRSTSILLVVQATGSTAPVQLSVALDTKVASSSSKPTSPRSATLLPTDSVGVEFFLGKKAETWFKVPVLPGKPVRARAWLEELALLQFFAGDSTPLGEDETDQIFLKSPVARFAYLRISMKNPLDTGTVTLHSWIDTVGLDEFEPDDTVDQANLLVLDGAPRRHIMQMRDYDWFRIAVKEGESYRIEIGEHTNIGIAAFKEGNANTSWFSSIRQTTVFRSDFTGTLHLRLGMWFYGLYTYHGGYPYTVRVVRDSSQKDAMEPDADRGSATVLTTGAALVERYIEGAEPDWFQFDLDSGKTYRFALEGFARCNMALYDATTQEKPWLTASGEFPIFRATKTGRHFLEYRSWSVSDTGKYRIGLRIDSTPDGNEPNETRSNAALVRIGEVNGSLPANDRDWFKFDVDSGSYYEVSIYGPSSAALRLYQDSTTSTDFDGGWTSVGLRARSKGRFFLDVAPNGSRAEVTGAYILSIESSK